MSAFSIQKFSVEKRTLYALIFGLCLMALLPEIGFAQTGFGKACTNVEKFFQNFETLLKVVSVIIVTIAIVFAGYQIAFAHKRLSDVAPILVGGLLIGGAAAIAGWFTAGWVGETAVKCST